MQRPPSTAAAHALMISLQPVHAHVQAEPLPRRGHPARRHSPIHSGQPIPTSFAMDLGYDAALPTSNRTNPALGLSLGGASLSTTRLQCSNRPSASLGLLRTFRHPTTIANLCRNGPECIKSNACCSSYTAKSTLDQAAVPVSTLLQLLRHHSPCLLQ